MTDAIKSFEIAVADEVLEDLRERLGRTRWPDQIPGAEWDYGTELSYIQDLCEYWRTEYDWREHEARFNAFDHFRTEIDGQNVHFIHARSPLAEATPLIITHGWPGSVTEFLRVIDPLRDPEAHGGDPADAFHVVAPSLPGYGWSGPTADRGWGPGRVAKAWAQLMARLGYGRYIGQGGDWGSMITLRLGQTDSDHVAGVHVNMLIALPPEGDDGSGVTEEEMAGLAAAGEFFENETGYQQIQGTKPQTLGYGLTDSPAGLAAWIAEKFLAWTDNDGTIESAVDRDDLLTNITVYWVTGTINSSIRLYYEAMKSGEWSGWGQSVDVPVGAAVFPKEIIRSPRKYAEAAYDLRHWTVMPEGGHFAAMEEPSLLVDDIRAFARTLKESGDLP